jgi:hypothetical protein
VEGYHLKNLNQRRINMEWLKELLGEELYNQVLPKLGDTKILKNDGSYIPVQKFNDKNEELKIIKAQLKDHENKSKDVEALLKDNDSLKEKYENLNSKYNTDLEAKNKEIKDITKKSFALRQLKDEGAVYEELLLKALDFNSIELDGETLKNFDIKDIRAKYPSMFTEKVTAGNVKPNNQNNQNNLGGTQKEKLIQQYNEFEKAGNFSAMLQIQDQIRKLE